MSKVGYFDRLREFLRSRRFLWIVTIAFGMVLVVYFLFVSFLFNPFEDDLDNTAAVVDSQVDYFLRWKGAGERFVEFPEPRIWGDLKGTTAFRQLEEGGEIAAWGDSSGLQSLLGELGATLDRLPPALDLESDLLREVAMAGRGQPGLDAAFDGVLLLRVSFKVKAGVALLGFGFVRDKLPENLGLRDLAGGRFVIPQFEPFGFQDAFLARKNDVLLIASSEEWLDRADELALQSGQGSLAQASAFYDNVEARLLPGDQPVEVFLRWSRMAAAFGVWPAGDSFEFWDRVIGRFFSTSLLRSVAGYWLPGKRFEARVSADLDLTNASSFQQSWYETQPVGVNRIRDVAGMVPADTFLLLAAAGDVGRVLTQMESSLDEDLRQILDEMLVNSGEYQGTAHFLQEVGETVTPGVLIALRRNDYPKDQRASDLQPDGTPVPAFVAIAGLRSEESYKKLIEFMINNAGRFSDDGKSKAFDTPIYRGTRATSLVSPAIPGTGELLFMHLPVRRAVLFSNSYRFLEQVVQVSFLSEANPDKPRLADRPEFLAALDELEAGPHFFAFLDPSEAGYWLDALAAWVADAKFDDSMFEVYERERPWIRRDELIKAFGSEDAQLDAGEEARLMDAVDAVLAARYADLRRQKLPGIQGSTRRGMMPLELLDWLSIGWSVGRRRASLVLSGELDLQ